MTVLVTGGGGYIGSHMATRLVERGESVVVLDNLTTGFRWACPREAEFVFGDVGEPRTLDLIFEAHAIDAVIHFAGSIVLPESVTDPLKYYRNNTTVSRTLIEACIRRGARHFIFSSTAAVYGTPKLNPVPETEAPEPTSPYGRSKLMTEMMLADCASAYGLGYVALRYFNVAGADPLGRTGQSSAQATNLVKIAVRAVLGLEPHLNIFGTDYPTHDGTGVRDYIHVCDLVEAHVAALEHLRGGGHNAVLNCGYGRGFSVRDVVEAVEAEARTKLAVRAMPRRPGDLAEVVADASRIRRELAWTPKYDDLAFIVRTALDWERHLNGLPGRTSLAAAQ